MTEAQAYKLSNSTETVTVHIEGVPLASLADALMAIDMADVEGRFSPVQHERLTKLVLGLLLTLGHDYSMQW